MPVVWTSQFQQRCTAFFLGDKGGWPLQQPLDRRAFLEPIQAQQEYEIPLEDGIYLGFFIPGDRVILSRMEQLTKKKTSPVVACPVTRLFR